MKNLKLIGARRLSRKGEIFEKGTIYTVSDEKADELLDVNDGNGNDYFAIATPKEVKAAQEAKAAKRAAQEAAAEEDEEEDDESDSGAAAARTSAAATARPRTRAVKKAAKKAAAKPAGDSEGGEPAVEV